MSASKRFFVSFFRRINNIWKITFMVNMSTQLNYKTKHVSKEIYLTKLYLHYSVSIIFFCFLFYLCFSYLFLFVFLSQPLDLSESLSFVSFSACLSSIPLSPCLSFSSPLSLCLPVSLSHLLCLFVSLSHLLCLFVSLSISFCFFLL